jgi:hypothetical protein
MLFRRKSTSRVCQSNRLGNVKKSRTGALSERNRHTKSLRIEPLEDRSLLSVATAALTDGATAYFPEQIRHAYGIDSIVSGTAAGDGEGQTIAIITAYNNPNLVDSTDAAFSTSDLYKFDHDSRVNLADPPSFIKLDQSGGKDYPTLPPTDDDIDWISESAMDVEWVHAIAPKANIILVEATSTSFEDTMAAINTARNLPGVSVISMSFGFEEGGTTGITAEQEASMDAILTTPAGHQGITFVAASGDDGSPGMYPALSPNVVAVGGTTLTIGSDNSYVGETGWADSGGGESQFESKPTYQDDVQTSSHRESPDVAFDADSTTGVAIYDSYGDSSGENSWKVAGGTSLSAPCWAGLVAIANQIRADQGRPTLDGVSQTLPYLYDLPASDFHDITSGGSAVVGYDLTTGRGTPVANLLVPQLALTAPGVTVNQATTQSDPTNGTTINFTVVFSESVTGFGDVASDVTIGGTATGNLTATVTGSGTTYNIAVRGMTSSGTVTVTIGAGVAKDADNFLNEASTSTDNTVTFDNVKPTVTINQATSQADPTKDGTIHFTVVFSEAVADFNTGDVAISGTAGATTQVITGSGTTYDVAISGMTKDGTVIATVPVAVAHDAAGNANEVSKSTDNSVTYDSLGPTVTVNKASSQTNPASTSPINFTVVFSEVVTDFSKDDLTITGTAGDTLVGTVTGSGTTYTVAVTGMTRDGTVTLVVGAGVAHDSLGNANAASTTTSNGNTVTYATYPTVTISKADGQLDPTTNSPIHYKVVFSEIVTGFTDEDVTVTDGAGDTLTAIVTGSGTTYDISVSGMTRSTSVTANIKAGVAKDAAGNDNLASNSLSVTYNTILSATVSLAEGQASTTGTSPVDFIVNFSEPVDDFTWDDVSVAGAALGSPAITPSITVTQLGTSGMTYKVAVAGAFVSGELTATVKAGSVHDTEGRPNDPPSNSAKVTFDATSPTVTVTQATSQGDPTKNSTINFTVVFSESVADFATGDVVLGGTAGAATAIVTGSGTTYNVAVMGMTQDGTVIVTVPASVAHDGVGNPNDASATTTDYTVTYDTTRPTAAIHRGAAQAERTTSKTITFRAEFSETVTDFATGDVTLGGTAGATTATVTQVDPDGKIYDIAVTGMTTDGTVIPSIAEWVAHDKAGNANLAVTSADLVTYDTIPTVTINQAADQKDPASKGRVKFTVVFSEVVTGFTADDVTLSGAAAVGATKSITALSADGLTYTITVDNITHSGAIIATVPASVAQDLAGNLNAASTSSDNAVVCDVVSPKVTIARAATQNDPTGVSPVKFTVTFDEAVSDFSSSDVTLSGTAEPSAASAVSVGELGTVYEVTVSGMAGEGTVVIDVYAGVAHDAAGNPNETATIVDHSVDYFIPPTVTINQAADQSDPAGAAPINFTVVFSEPVVDFSKYDVVLSGTAGATGVEVTKVGDDGTTYNVAVSGMSRDGTVIATVIAGAAYDTDGHPNVVSTSTDNTVTYHQLPSVTINQAATQADPTNAKTIHFTVVFSEAVTDFTKDDVTLAGTVSWTDAKTITVTPVSGSTTTYDVAVSGMTGSGTVIASLAAGVAHNAEGDATVVSTSTDNSVFYFTDLTMTVSLATNQNDPATGSTVNFTVVFSEPVSDFATGDVSLSGTAGATTKTVTAVGTAGTTYNVAVTGMKTEGTVAISIAAGAAHGAAGNANPAGSKTVTYRTSPIIDRMVVAETNTPKNGVLEADEVLKLTWATTSKKKLASQAVTIDGRKVTTISGPFSGLYYSCSLGKLGAGSHTYVIKATDSAGIASSVTGTFTVVAVAGPVISKVAIAEAVSQNSIVESGESLKMTWSTTSTKGISSQTVSIDGKPISRYSGPFSGQYYSCNIGQLSAGKHVYVIRAMDKRGVISVASNSFTVASPLAVAAAQAPKASATSITDAQLAPIVAEAMLRLESQLGTQIETTLAGVNFKIANLSSGLLGETAGKTIWIDNDAAGYGWFVDSTPADDVEFSRLASSTTLTARAGSAADQRADLLTAVMHEMGHVLGFEHIADGLMSATLPLGARRTA